MNFNKFSKEDLKSKKAKFWWFILYPESAPENWFNILKDELLIPCAISPLHTPDSDDGTLKEHYHVIIEWGNTTTFKTIQETFQPVLNCTIPFPVPSLKGAYEYLTHKNHPEKQQFGIEQPLCLGGFEYDKHKFDDVKYRWDIFNDIIDFISENKICEYSSLITYYMHTDYEYLVYVKSNSIFFKTYLQSRKYVSKSEIAKINKLLGLDDVIDETTVDTSELMAEIEKLDNML